jgi:VWFA-related protein
MRALPTLRVALAIAATVVAAASAQQPQPPRQSEPPPVTFRAEANFIEVDAFVTDQSGVVVTDLTAADFELLEDDRPQEILSFASVNLPIDRLERPLFAPRPIEPDVRTNEGGEGRIYLILLDDIHVHPARIPRVRAALHQFIERNFGTNDLAAVVRVRGGSQDSQEFTNNPRLLLRAIDRFTGNVPREVVPAVPAGLPLAGSVSSVDLQEGHDARDVMSRVRELSEFMAGVRGRRKAMLFVSEGSPFDLYQATGQLGGIASIVGEDVRKATAAAARGNVTIYPIDPRGLIPMDANDLSGSEPPTGGRLRLSQDYLRALAADTGGFASINQNDPNRAFDRIVRENSSYYILGYSPSNDRRDGGFRRLQVRVKRPGLQVRARSGYMAPSGRRPATARPPAGVVNAAVASALSSPLPTSGFPVRVFASPYRGGGREASVVIAVETDASGFDFVEKGGLFTEQLELVHAATDSSGKVHPTVRHVVALSLKPDTHARMTAGGLRVLSQAELPPGRYQLRVAVGNGGRRAGGVVYDLDVPDFSAPGLTMSGLSLTSSSAPSVVTIDPQKSRRVQLPTPIVTTREFRSPDTLLVFGEVYENGRALPAHTLDITTELRTDTGSVARKSTETRSSNELRNSSVGYGFTAEMPLEGLGSGVYVIHAEARSNVGDRPVVSRDIQIRVR